MTFSLAARRTQRQVICATLLCLTVVIENKLYQSYEVQTFIWRKTYVETRRTSDMETFPCYAP